jgi:hypothetical protein
MNVPITKQMSHILTELEAVADEIRIKVHLAGMEASSAWTDTLEPKLFDARMHARDAKDASKAVLQDTLAAFKDFQKSL